MQTLGLPPAPCLGADASVGQPFGAFGFQKEHGCDGQLHPSLDCLKALEAVLSESQCRLQLFEEQLRIPFMMRSLRMAVSGEQNSEHLAVILSLLSASDDGSGEFGWRLLFAPTATVAAELF